MMRALAVETSGRVGSVAAVEDGRVLGELTFPHGLKHAAGILPLIDTLCRERGWRPRDVGELYVSAGPGSFTGLRIGITLAKTMALATGVKVVAVPSVRVLAENAPAEARHVVIVLDAKRGQIYTALYQRTNDGWEEREPAHLDRLADVLERVLPRLAAGEHVHLLGEGIPYHKAEMPENPAVVATAEDLWRARASAVATIGYGMARRGEFADPLTLAPTYIRPPEAEEKWAERHGEAGR